MKVKKGDKVKVVKGRDSGKEGVIEKVFLKTGKVQIEGVNIYKKHQKSQGEKKPGGIITITKPVFAENIRLICPKCAQPTRVGYRVLKDGARERFCKKCKEGIK